MSQPVDVIEMDEPLLEVSNEETGMVIVIESSSVDDCQVIETSHHPVVSMAVHHKSILAFKNEVAESDVGFEKVTLVIRPDASHIALTQSVTEKKLAACRLEFSCPREFREEGLTILIKLRLERYFRQVSHFAGEKPAFVVAANRRDVELFQ
jgi:hypothetical protein